MLTEIIARILAIWPGNELLDGNDFCWGWLWLLWSNLGDRLVKRHLQVNVTLGIFEHFLKLSLLNFFFSTILIGLFGNWGTSLKENSLLCLNTTWSKHVIEVNPGSSNTCLEVISWSTFSFWWCLSFTSSIISSSWGKLHESKPASCLLLNHLLDLNKLIAILLCDDFANVGASNKLVDLFLNWLFCLDLLLWNLTKLSVELLNLLNDQEILHFDARLLEDVLILSDVLGLLV